jgi:hypothetical protein
MAESTSKGAIFFFKLFEQSEAALPGLPGKPFWFNQNMACFTYLRALMADFACLYFKDSP